MVVSRGQNDISYALGLIALAAIYLVTARLGLGLGAVSGFATPVWPPTGIALFALLCFGARLWPGVFAGALIANLVTGAPPLAALGIAAGNTVEAVMAMLLLRRANFDVGLSRVRDVGALLILAACVSTTLSATIGVLSLRLGGVIGSAAVFATWRTWWVGDALGALLVAPLLVVWAKGTPRLAAKPIEAVVVLVTLCGVSLVVFHDLIPGEGDGFLRQAYATFPILVWAALRFRQHGAATATFVAAVVAIAGTAQGHGPFASNDLSQSLLSLQIFMGIAAITTLALAAAVMERDAAEAERERLHDQTQEAIRARDEFLSVASHELRTPLTSLELQVETLRHTMKKTYEPVAPEKLDSKLEVIERQLDRLNGLVEDLLDVSRAVAGRFALELEPVDLGSVAVEATARLQDQARAAGSELTLKTAECFGHWDRLRLDQIVTNLVSNAIKFGPGKPVEVEVIAEQGHAILKVRDYGIGIKPEDQDRVFQRFERAVSKRHFGGLGLGLWIVRQIVEALGGSITLTSSAGHGCQFTVRLPLMTAQATATEPDKLPAVH